ncbi:putative ATP-dependent RNA helicase YTHDC2-like protein [Leptotrombidium deliense]|uniref:Putative ATP-dependent RNA helicase YTHDC2-like protein n=1 Tax=Leptotrombidium deliense TaxID=299467 RepID=A0A443SV77_9ACAR|nr:putative ATP-dependent RNA helicase YTHDC2-like protein [Leptotrombidium deliense]
MTRHEVNARINEEVKISVDSKLNAFIKDETQREYEFPSSLTSEERRYVHQYCGTLGLKTKSRGKGFARCLTIYKSEGSSVITQDAGIAMGRISQQHTLHLLQRYPVSDKERKELQPFTEKERINSATHGNVGIDSKELNCTTGRLSSVIPQVPPPVQRSSSYNDLLLFRQSLPIWSCRNNIVRAIDENNVVLISGDTGCGKTTQVPQFILEYSTFAGKPCRVITTEPRRLAALSVAERVAFERGENIGQTVGYQIRLESKVSPKTLLTFCTNGVLLRTLMGGDNGLSNITHILIDEVHERDRLSDLLLLIIREMLSKFSHLKLIVMSATIDTERFSRYFGDCPVIRVSGIQHKVSTFFLEDVLKLTNYWTPEMKKCEKSLKQRDKKQQVLFEWCCSRNTNTSQSFQDDVLYQSNAHSLEENNEKLDLDLDPNLKKAVDDAIKISLFNGKNEDFEELLSLIMNENVSVDYQHSETGVTALIAAVCHGKIIYIETLLSLGASITLCTPNNWDAVKWAKNTNQSEVCELLEAYWQCCNERSQGAVEFENIEKVPDLSDEEKQLLEIYHRSFNDEEVDIKLILALLQKICLEGDFSTPDEAKGAILVFLPGYDEIVNLRELILSDFQHFDSNKYVLFTLHSQMQSNDHKRVFKRVPPDVRKIILATNLAETSITIDDVMYVIDSGKVKEKSYEPSLGVSMLKSTWISQASAVQRSGRAGRCRSGVCYHLFSKYRYSKMSAYQIPEILRIPIHELCLQSKLLAANNCSINEFLSKALDPPSLPSINNSVHLLKTIDALDPFEQLTELGLHLLDLPVEPNLGKMILYSVVLKCLDPVLTIVCTLAYRDPFVIPSQPAQKRAAAVARKKLASGTRSDHMILLRAFQAWQKARNDGVEKDFLDTNFVGSSTMEMIVGMRTQLLGQLRASGFVRARGVGDIRDLNTNSENWAVVKAAICAGCYPNMIRVDRDRKQLVTLRENKVRFHPCSVFNSNPGNPKENIYKNRAQLLENIPSDWIVYEEMTRIGRVSYARCCTLVSPIVVAIFAGAARLPSDALHENDAMSSYSPYADPESDSESEEKTEREKAMLKIDDWIQFKVNPDIARLVFQLRQKWHSLFLKRMSVPAKPLSQSDDAVIKTIVDVLTAEDMALGLPQPAGIGQRPRPMSTDFCPPVSNTELRSPVQSSRMKQKISLRANHK